MMGHFAREFAVPIRVLIPTASARTWFDPRNAVKDTLGNVSAGLENAANAIKQILRAFSV
jgi:hypothetical protein